MPMQVHFYEEVWNRGNEKAIDDLLAPGAVGHGLTDPQGREVTGTAAFKEFWHTMRGAFSDIHISVEQTVSEGDLEVARLLITGKHTGDGLPFPPKGNPVQISGMSMVRVKDGRIEESWSNIDFLAMFQQIQAPSSQT
jgi:predicted ester cyclase